MSQNLPCIMFHLQIIQYTPKIHEGCMCIKSKYDSLAPNSHYFLSTISTYDIIVTNYRHHFRYKLCTKCYKVVLATKNVSFFRIVIRLLLVMSLLLEYFVSNAKIGQGYTSSSPLRQLCFFYSL